jgi:hypothetical protein
MKTAYRTLAIFVLALGTISQHTTASAVEMFKFNGLGANASFSSVDPSGCILTNVDVFTAEAMIKVHPGKRGPFSSVNIFLSQHDLCTDTAVLAAEGVADLAEPDLQISSKLHSATLNTTITVLNSLTGNSFDVAIDLAWTGIAPVTREHSNFHFGDQTCRFHNRFKGTFRAAEASGSVFNGTMNFTPEPSVGALLVSSNSQDMAIGCS